jgi:hypothetical protein
MAFCTRCGANLTGSFCSLCGNPAQGVTGQPQSAPPGAPAQSAMPTTQQPVTGAPPQGGPIPAQQAPPMLPAGPIPRKTSPIVWVLVGVLGVILLGWMATAAVVGIVAHRLHQAGVAVNNGRDGGVKLQTRGADGKQVEVEFGGSGGKLPSWVPEYPGSKESGHFAARGSSETGEEGGAFIFTTSDPPDRVKSFYMDKAKELGMKSTVDTTTSQGGIFVAAEEGDHPRSLTVMMGSSGNQTTVNLMYGKK